MRIESNGYIPTGDPVVDRVAKRVYKELKIWIPKDLTDEDIQKMVEEAKKNKHPFANYRSESSEGGDL